MVVRLSAREYGAGSPVLILHGLFGSRTNWQGFARRLASARISISIKLSFTGGQVDWMMNTSRPRTFSLILTNVSPSGNELTVASPRGTPM